MASKTLRKIDFCITPEGKLPEGAKKALMHIVPQFADKRVTMTIDIYKDKRSNKQNAYWFTMLDMHVVPEIRALGSNVSSYKFHEWLVGELGYETAEMLPNGKVIAIREETSKFDKSKWEEFMERARAYLSTEMGIFIPLPNEPPDM